MEFQIKSGYDYFQSSKFSVFVRPILGTSSERNFAVFLGTGKHKSWLYSELEIIDAQIFQHGYLENRIEKGLEQIKLWSKLGSIEKGEKVFKYLMDISLDIRGEDDPQLDYIANWLEVENSSTTNELNFYLERLDSICDRVNSPSQTPSKELLKLSIKHGNGFQVFKYMLFNGLVYFNDSLEIIFSYFLNVLPEYKKIVYQSVCENCRRLR